MILFSEAARYGLQASGSGSDQRQRPAAAPRCARCCRLRGLAAGATGRCLPSPNRKAMFGLGAEAEAEAAAAASASARSSTTIIISIARWTFRARAPRARGDREMSARADIWILRIQVLNKLILPRYSNTWSSTRYYLLDIVPYLEYMRRGGRISPRDARQGEKCTSNFEVLRGLGERRCSSGKLGRSVQHGLCTCLFAGPVPLCPVCWCAAAHPPRRGRRRGARTRNYALKCSHTHTHAHTRALSLSLSVFPTSVRTYVDQQQQLVGCIIRAAAATVAAWSAG
jgi:hypothetical protein